VKIAIISQRVLGHIYPVLGLGEELKSRLNEVIILSHKSNKILIEMAGLQYGEMGWGKFVDKNIGYALADIKKVLESIKPDLFIVDSGMPAAAYAAELLAIPWVSFQTTLPSTCYPHSSQDKVSLRMQRQYEADLNQIRTQFGLSLLNNDIRSRGDLAGLSPYLHLVMVYPDLLSGEGFLPPNTKVIGPCAPTFDKIPAGNALTPNIVVCASSLPRIEFREIMNRYVQACIRVMGGEDYRVVIIESQECENLTLLPSNVVWTTEVPSHHLYMPGANLIITHGGCGTLQKAIKYGVPMIIIPLGEDHYSLGAQCVNLGIATMIPPERLTEQTLLQQTNEVLQNCYYLNNIQALSRKNEELLSNQLAVDYIEQWYKSRIEK